MIKVRWKCRHYFGGHSEILFDFEDFCENWFITDVSEEDWDMERAAAICPECGFEVTQKHNLPEVL